MNEEELSSIDPDEQAEMHDNRFLYRYPMGEVSVIDFCIKKCLVFFVMCCTKIIFFFHNTT